MRLLFTMAPGYGHLFPLVPLAVTAAMAGDDVLIATTGPNVEAAANAGLSAYDVAGGADVTGVYTGLQETIMARELSADELKAEAGRRFGAVGELMLDGLVTLARRWHADAIVYPPALAAGLLAATAAGIPAVLHGIGLRRPTYRPAMLAMSGAARRWGVDELPERPRAEITVCPDSLEPEPVGSALPMRYLPYNGGIVLPEWAIERGQRPRVCVTLGSLSATIGRGELLAKVIDAVSGLPVELVLTSAGAGLSALPDPLPANVRVVDWLPMRVLLPTCRAIVHHGGAGTTFSAFAAGIPQVIVPHGGDRPMNARLIEAKGAGVELSLATADPEAIAASLNEVLRAPGYRDAARAIAGELAAMPAPAEVLPRLREHAGLSR
ncbi:nucleotide disphospho-sugar-binding domain-containing protein [Amycolatopsis sp. NPDC059021]|uniref:nucleotide disphospho-sugar-binding domain-containing protein n=1 Tax=Amycolatopsis sp. NPDC059021 TaxID=3346704 RepID=UPI00366CBD5A